jgi:hypothetical protein
MVGIGLASCATWLSDAGHEAEGTAWLWGYWTGLNSVNPSQTMVGSTTDAQGIAATVKAQCKLDPAEKLVDATRDVYIRFAETGR